MPTAALLTGVLFALAAGLMWGLVFIGPLLLPEYPASLQAFGRHIAFGVIALPLAWLDRQKLRQLTRTDWLEAMKLTAVGSIIYYLFLASAIQRAGGPLPTMIIGTLPVVIAITSQLRVAAPGARVEARLPWARLWPSLLLMGAGIALVNQVELEQLQRQPHADVWRYAFGGGLAICAVACWTWYPLRNAEWLRAHPDRNPRSWSTAQGVATLPMAVLGYALAWAWLSFSGNAFAMPLGPTPAKFVGLMLAIGLFASWLGSVCWNEASQRLPPALAGQLIAFEALAALTYMYWLRREWPGTLTLTGVAFLVMGVALAVRGQHTQSSGRANQNSV
jgi:drug/metabolite transporter (DMT)-like permease